MPAKAGCESGGGDQEDEGGDAADEPFPVHAHADQ